MEEVLRDILPSDYSYKVLNCEMQEMAEDNTKFSAEVRVNCLSETDVKGFLSELNISSCFTYNIAAGWQDKRKNGRSQCRGYSVVSQL